MAETLQLGIPVLMTPTPKQFEQEINAKMQTTARPDQYAMFHPDATIRTARIKTVELIEPKAECKRSSDDEEVD